MDPILPASSPTTDPVLAAAAASSGALKRRDPPAALPGDMDLPVPSVHASGAGGDDDDDEEEEEEEEEMVIEGLGGTISSVSATPSAVSAAGSTVATSAAAALASTTSPVADPLGGFLSSAIAASFPNLVDNSKDDADHQSSNSSSSESNSNETKTATADMDSSEAFASASSALAGTTGAGTSSNANLASAYYNDDEEDEDAGRGGGAAAVTSGSGVGVSAYAQRLMQQMGYSGAGGLGARGTGIVAPVEAHTDRMVSQMGLGYDAAVTQASHESEELKPSPTIEVAWVPPLPSGAALPAPPPADEEDFTAGAAVPTPTSWASVGPATMSMTDPGFCPLDVQTTLFAAKSVFDTVGDRQFLSARDRSNPFELLKKEIFQNRAALKMAEIDAACKKLFTEPPVFHETFRRSRRRELLYFGDVCAGPGGFTEFMMTAKKWRAKGFGFTLKGSNDFKTQNFNCCAPPHSFKAYYGVDGTGDVTNSENLRDYARHVWTETHGQGLHVMLADGGFSVAGKENYQELLSRQLVLCQFAAAIATLREGGVFVCKLFDTFLRFTVDCMYLMRLAFKDVAIIKPNQSRPANSERYVVCRGLRRRGGLDHPILQYMLRVNDKMNAIDPLGAQMAALEAKIAAEQVGFFKNKI